MVRMVVLVERSSKRKRRSSRVLGSTWVLGVENVDEERVGGIERTPRGRIFMGLW